MSVDRAILFRLATSGRLERAARAFPQGEQRAWRAASRYVAGKSFDAATGVAEDPDQRGAGTSIDQFGEMVTDRCATWNACRRPESTSAWSRERTSSLRLARTDAEFAAATHDAVLREAPLTALGPRPIEQLLGVRPDALDDLAARGVPVRVYLPFGQDWYRFSMRRLAESRGA